MEIGVNTAGAADYGDAYYADYSADHIVYEHNAQWQAFFGGVADRLIADFAPKTTLDAGCAIGLLVEALRDRGVDADGIDFSEFAIARARDDIRGHLTLGSITEPLQRRYDLITCFEVLEHLSPQDADKAIANLCAFSDNLIVSSTPMHYRDPTHTNIHPQEYWTERFARHGFIRDVDYDATYIVAWATRYRRSSAPIHRVVADYDRAYSRMHFELEERNALVMEQMREIGELKQRLEQLESRAGWTERPAARIARRADDLGVKAAPRGTLRHDLLASLYHAMQRLARRLPHD